MPDVPITVSKNFLSTVNSFKHAQNIWDDITTGYEKVFAIGKDGLHRKYAKNLCSIELGQKRRVVLLRTDENDYIPVFYADNHDKYEDFLDNAPPETIADIQLADTTLDVHFKIAEAVKTLNNLDFDRQATISPPTSEEYKQYEDRKLIDEILHDPDTEGFVAKPDGSTAYFLNMDRLAIVQVDETNGKSIIHIEDVEDTANNKDELADQALDNILESFDELQIEAQNAYATIDDKDFGDLPAIVGGGIVTTLSLFSSTFNTAAPITTYAGSQAKGFLSHSFNNRAPHGYGDHAHPSATAGSYVSTSATV